MKSLFKYVSGAALAGLLSVAFIPDASAQRGARGGGAHLGGGGGGFRGGGISLRGGSGTSIFRGGVSGGGISAGYRGGYYGGRYFYGYPTVGFHLGGLPFGYYPFYFGADLYYYYGGVFYRPYDDGGYEVTTPPVGAAVPALPKGAEPIAIDGQQYYEFNGVYYQQSVDDQNKTVYVVAGKDGVLNTNGDNAGNPPPAPQVGDVINQLPDGSRKITLNGKKYFVDRDGIYYQEFTDSHNYKAYRIVSVPADDDQEKQQ